VKVGDLVKAPHVEQRNVGFIVHIKKTNVSHKLQYWVKLLDREMGPFPFLASQLEILSKSS